MVERIEKITKVKAVDYDINRPFERKDGYEEEKRKKQNFQATLHNAMKRRALSEEDAPVAEAYTVDLSRATQSLFYKRDIRLELPNLGRKNDAGR